MNFKALPLALILVLSVAVLAACGGSDDDTSTSATPTIPDVSVDTANVAPYPQDVKDEFLKSCAASSEGQKSLCGCLLKAFEETLPVDDFEAINNPQPGEAPPAMPTETQDRANACVEDGQTTG